MKGSVLLTDHCKDLTHDFAVTAEPPNHKDDSPCDWRSFGVRLGDRRVFVLLRGSAWEIVG